MELFLDTANIDEIRDGARLGVITGVTTNPSLAAKEGIGSARAYKSSVQEIARMIAPLPLSVEVTTNDRFEMIEQAQQFSEWADNINVKITIMVR